MFNEELGWFHDPSEFHELGYEAFDTDDYVEKQGKLVNKALDQSNLNDQEKQIIQDVFGGFILYYEKNHPLNNVLGRGPKISDFWGSS